jgi:hypothetical protein
LLEHAEARTAATPAAIQTARGAGRAGFTGDPLGALAAAGGSPSRGWSGRRRGARRPAALTGRTTLGPALAAAAPSPTPASAPAPAPLALGGRAPGLARSAALPGGSLPGRDLGPVVLVTLVVVAVVPAVVDGRVLRSGLGHRRGAVLRVLRSLLDDGRCGSGRSLSGGGLALPLGACTALVPSAAIAVAVALVALLAPFPAIAPVALLAARLARRLVPLGGLRCGGEELLVRLGDGHDPATDPGIGEGLGEGLPGEQEDGQLPGGRGLAPGVALGLAEVTSTPICAP